jgi:hypothetical protein
MDTTTTKEIELRVMREQALERVWTIPSCEGSGPVTMTLRVPEVTIKDSAGRYIVISPQQSAIVSEHLESINDWLQYGLVDETEEEN